MVTICSVKYVLYPIFWCLSFFSQIWMFNSSKPESQSFFVQIFSYSSSSSETLTEKEDHNWACLCCCCCCCGLIVDLLFHFSSSFSLKSNFRSFSRSNFAPFDVSFCYQKNSSTNRKNFVLFMFSFSVKYLLVFLCRLFSSFHFCSKKNRDQNNVFSRIFSLCRTFFCHFNFQIGLYVCSLFPQTRFQWISKRLTNFSSLQKIKSKKFNGHFKWFEMYFLLNLTKIFFFSLQFFYVLANLRF